MAYILYQCHQKDKSLSVFPDINYGYLFYDRLKMYNALILYMLIVQMYVTACGIYIYIYVCYVYSTYVSYSTISLNIRLHLSTCLSNCEVIIENKVYNNGPFFHRKLGCILDLFYLFVCPFTLLENWLNVVHSPSVKFKIDLHNSSVQNTFTKKKTSNRNTCKIT